MGELRVLLVSGEYPPMEGGVADFTAILGAALSRLGADVHVLTSVDAADGQDTSLVTCHPIVPRWGALTVWRALRATLDHSRAQVVDIQYQTAAFGLCGAINTMPALMRQVPWVTTFHDLREPYLFPKAGRLRHRFNVMLARNSRACIVTNAEDEERLLDDVMHTPVERVPIGSNVSAARPEGYDRDRWRTRYGRGRDDLLLCYFGFLNESKGGEDLIEALSLLRQRGTPAHVIMIGGATGASDSTNEEYLQRVKETIAELELEDHITWTGYLDDAEVSACLDMADACVLPYRDGASFRRGTLMAALAHGAAIVTTQPEFPVPELIHRQNAWLVPTRSPSAIADAVQELERRPGLRAHLGRGARALSNAFSWDAIAQRTLDILTRVANA